MFDNKRLVLVAFVAVAVLTGLFVVLTGRSQTEHNKTPEVQLIPFGQSAKEIDDSAAPVVDLTNPYASDRLDANSRKLKNVRHDKSGPFKIDSYSGVAEVRSDPERRSGFTDLPVGKSELIVEGVVSESRAFLSEDKTGVYSEFTVVVAKTLKVAPGLSVNIGDRIVTERFGGRVRYPAGQVVRFRIPGEGVPIVGKRYLFFLTKADPQSYSLLTAYEIEGNKVSALDGSRTEPRGLGESIFDKHNGEDLDLFMAQVSRAISKSSSEGAKP